MSILSRRDLVKAGVTVSALVTTSVVTGSALANEAATFAPGTYTVTVPSIKGDMTVATSFNADVITDVHVISCVDSNVIKDVAIQSVCPRIVEQQNIEVDAVAGATMTSLAIKNAVAQAIKLAGGDPVAFEKGSDALAEKPQGEDETYDIVVIGAGAAGLSAALTAAREESAPSVLLLEKQAFIGGCYRVCGGGMWTFNAPINEWVGQDCSKEDLIDFMTRRSGEYPINEELWSNIFDISGEIFMNLWKEGVGFNPLTWSLGNAQSQIPCFWTLRHSDIPWEDVVSGWSDQEKLIVDRAGVETRVNSRVIELVTDGSKVEGVVVEDLEKVYTVHAKKVIIATGGFTQNMEYRDQYAPEFENAFAFTSAGDTGDGITLTRDLDVPIVGNGMMGLMGLNPALGYYGEFGSLVWLPQMCVNAEGEPIDLSIHYGDTLKLICDQTDGHIFGIFDATNAVAERLEKALALGYVSKYDSLEELAAGEGIAADAFVASTANLAEGPYYCIIIRPLFIGSIPGLQVDEKCHVINASGEIVENLYAAGMCMFGNVFNIAYPSSGTGVGTSHYTGAIAARDAVAAL
ncbi:MAG: FAD-dependent oxidoreductase [Coriobacteriales bacterium]|nr:FAD-dependent oxidoreductase [Coriobacteriales bacterium]